MVCLNFCTGFPQSSQWVAEHNWKSCVLWNSEGKHSLGWGKCQILSWMNVEYNNKGRMLLLNGRMRRLVSAQMSISPIIPAAQWCLMFSLFFTVNQVFFQCKHPYPLFLSDNLISGWRYNPQTEVMSSRLPRVREVLVASHILLRTERCTFEQASGPVPCL